MSEIKTENTELTVSIPLDALNNLTLSSLGMYVILTVMIPDGEIELEDLTRVLNETHGSMNVSMCFGELEGKGFLTIREEDGTGDK
jgi:hypothetical protein